MDPRQGEQTRKSQVIADHNHTSSSLCFVIRRGNQIQITAVRAKVCIQMKLNSCLSFIMDIYNVKERAVQILHMDEN